MDRIHILDVRPVAHRRGREAGRLAAADGSFLIHEADSLEGARAVLAEQEVDCAVYTLHSDDPGALDGVASVRERDPDLPVVVYAADGNEQLASAALSAGVDEYVSARGHEDPVSVLAERVREVVRTVRTTAQQESDRFAALFENIPEPTIVASFEDGTPIVKRVNREFEAVFGYDAEAIVGSNVDSFILPPDAKAQAEALNVDLTEGKSVQTSVTRLTASGPREFRLHVVPRRRHPSNVEGYAIYEDLTPIKERERVLEALHAAATDIVAAESTHGVCARTIAAAQGILEFDLCEISLESEGYLVPKASSEEMAPSAPSAIPVEQGIGGKTYRTGESFVVEDAADSPVADPQGPWKSAVSVPIGSHGVFQAVAKAPSAFDERDRHLAELLVSHTAETLTRIETEEALRDREATLRAQKERLEKFTTVLSHDLRNPLNVATGRLELAMADRDDSHLETVARAHERMQELVDDVLTLARQGGSVREPEVLDLRSVLETCFANVDTKNATVQVEMDRRIRADPGRLQSAVENLFRNAVEHGREDATIRVGPLEDGFYVEDDGPGIPPGERESVLEPGVTTAENGTGLGLSIVSEAAEAHGWSVTITEGTDGGARVEITGVDVLDPPELSAEG